MSRALKVEVRKGALAQPIIAGGAIEITPPLDEDYWLLRVRLTPTQAIVAFPKFSMLGVGFAREKDWNTNLPWSCGADEIYNHIAHNKGDKRLSRARCVAAIVLVQQFIREKNLDAPRNTKYDAVAGAGPSPHTQEPR